MLRMIPVYSLVFIGSFLLVYGFLRNRDKKLEQQQISVVGNQVFHCQCTQGPLIKIKEPTFHEMTTPSDN